jgi:hypothetical protein
MRQMTVRERMLAVMERKEHDRVPLVMYDLSEGGFPEKSEVRSYLGLGNIGFLRWTWLHEVETPHCHFEQEEIIRGDRKGLRRTLFTPEGRLQEERFFEPVYNSSSAASHFVKEPDDYRLLMAYLRDIRVDKNLETWRNVYQNLAEEGLPHTSLMRSPYQQLWIEWTGIQELGVHIRMYPDLIEEVTTLMRDVQRRLFQVVCEAAREVPLPYINFPDNITAPMIGDAFFQEYCVSSYNELAGMLEDAGVRIPVQVHMDGDLKPLWGSIGASRVRSLDSMSPPPDNDTSVAEAMSRWPEMIVCINFPSSVHLLEPEAIYAKTMEILEEGGRQGRLQIQISENVPPGAWRKSFPQIAKAIADFGPACR